MDNDEAIKQKIIENVENVYDTLDKTLKEWLMCHVIEPKKIKIAANLDGKTWTEVWLVTDNKSDNDSSYRIVFDPGINTFGLECTLDSGLEWYMGAYGSLSETIEKM
jgi:hypothetical protein